MPSPSVRDYAASSASRVMQGPGLARPLTGLSLSNLIMQRSNDLDWYTYNWKCVGRPISSAGAGNNQADALFFYGTNAAAGNAVFSIEGPGLNISTAGANNDQYIIQPVGNDEAGAPACLGGTASFWNTTLEPGIVITISTGTDAADLQNMRLYAGLKLTITDVPTTDADQAIFICDANGLTSAVNWRCNTRIAAVADDFNTTTPVRSNTIYQLGVLLDEGRRPHYFLGQLVAGVLQSALVRVGAPMRSLATLVPTFGIAARGAAGPVEFDLMNVWMCQRTWLRV